MLQEAFKYFLSASTILVMVISACANAEELRGEVIRAYGAVHIIDATGNHHTVEESRFPVREMDTIVTAEGGNAIVRFNDGVLSVLDGNSRLRVERPVGCLNWAVKSISPSARFLASHARLKQDLRL